MYKKIIATLAIFAMLGLLLPVASAAEPIMKTDVEIEAGSYTKDMLATDKGDEVDVKVTSDVPVDVLIMRYEDVGFTTGVWENALITKSGITSTEFTFTPDDEGTYALVIRNTGTENATVDYEYTDLAMEDLEEAVEEAEGFLAKLGTTCCILIVVGVLGLIGVIILIVFLVKKKKNK